MNGNNRNQISTITRTAIVDEVQLSGLYLYGKRDEVAFLSRIFDLGSLPTTDGRFKNMAEDIWQHRINNHDWQDDWLFTDDRINLMNGPDDVFLNFLSEMVHPLVRPDAGDVTQLLDIFNMHLKADGWEIAEKTKISGRPIFAGRKLVLDVAPSVAAAKDLAAELNAEYMTQQINRMETAIDKDPELAIGTAKEFIETVCKGILKQRGVATAVPDDFPALVKFTVKQLKIVPDGLDGQTEAEKTIRILVNNLSSIGTSLAELRNPYGTGHGKGVAYKGLEEHHARLAVGLATTVGVFLFQAHQKDA